MPTEFVLNNKINVKKYGFSKGISVVEYKKNLVIDKNKKTRVAVLVNDDHYGKVNGIIQKLYGKTIIIVKAKNNEFNRKVFENKKVDMIIDLETQGEKDKLKQRNSGLNHVLCKLATKNNIIIAINLQNIISKQEKEKSQIIARIKQNIKLCKKAKTKIIITCFAKSEDNMRNLKDLQSLCLVLKMDTKTAKEAVEKKWF